MKNLILLFLLSSAATAASAYSPASTTSPTSVKNNGDLVFPVAGQKSNVGSFWGARREGGKRKHEGIDIFAKKGTPVVAISDGIVTKVAEMPKGGKIVWMQCDGREWNVYYAHLDKQLVKEGQRVQKGEVIGTVGNTGNARTTPSHLHFGIYTGKGAVDPYPYVKNLEQISEPYHLQNDQHAILADNEKIDQTVTIKQSKRNSL